MPRGRLWLVCLLMVLLAAPAVCADDPVEEANALNQKAVEALSSRPLPGGPAPIPAGLSDQGKGPGA